MSIDFDDLNYSDAFFLLKMAKQTLPATLLIFLMRLLAHGTPLS
jgi:hypothetical protein